MTDTTDPTLPRTRPGRLHPSGRPGTVGATPPDTSPSRPGTASSLWMVSSRVHSGPFHRSEPVEILAALAWRAG